MIIIIIVILIGPYRSLITCLLPHSRSVILLCDTWEPYDQTSISERYSGSGDQVSI